MPTAFSDSIDTGTSIHEGPDESRARKRTKDSDKDDPRMKLRKKLRGRAGRGLAARNAGKGRGGSVRNGAGGGDSHGAYSSSSTSLRRQNRVRLPARFLTSHHVKIQPCSPHLPILSRLGGSQSRRDRTRHRHDHLHHTLTTNHLRLHHYHNLQHLIPNSA